MLYAVGTHIDLRYLNGPQSESQSQPVEREERRSAGYPVGTKIIFLKDFSERTVLKITPKLFVVNTAVSA